MQDSKHIMSLKNPLVKKVMGLKAKSRERKKSGLFVIEGQRELELAIKAGYKIEQLLVCPDISNSIPSQESKRSIPIVLLSREVYEKMAHRGSTEGVMAIARLKSHDLGSIALHKNPLILVAEAPEKPGNIGALLRTADAANLDAVLIANPISDLYNPNVIRSSVGCVFTTQIGMGSTEDIIHFLKSEKISIFCAALTANQKYTHSNFTGPSAIVVGTEATGLSSEWLNNTDQNIIIPMLGEIDSMNVSVSAAILIFEAKRQRGF